MSVHKVNLHLKTAPIWVAEGQTRNNLMKKIINFALLMLLFPFSGWSYVGERFNAETKEGANLMYEVTSEKEKTCTVIRLDDDYYNGSITIPSEVNDYIVTAIGSWAFEGRGLDVVVIPATVKSIGDGAFFCTILTIVSLIENPFDLGDSFAGEYDEENDTYTIHGELIVPTGTTDKYLKAEGWKNFESITEMMPEGKVFTDKSIEGVEISFRINGIMTCEVYSDYGKAIPEEAQGVVTIPEMACGLYTVTAIADNACKYYMLSTSQQITEIIIPETVTTIGENFCKGLTSLKKLFIPKNVTRIGLNSFLLCEGLESIEVDESNLVFDSRENCNAIINTEYNSMFVGCKNTFIPSSVTGLADLMFESIPIKQITIPESIRIIPSMCFYNSGLKSMTLPEGLETIGREAFYSTQLESIRIPQNVKEIKYGAFSRCGKLKSVVSMIEEPFSILDATFEGAYESATLYVPKGTKAKYETTDGWKLFNRIVELDADSNIPTEINEMPAETNAMAKECYNMNGQRIGSGQQGLNIVRMSDGSVKKVLNQ